MIPAGDITKHKKVITVRDSTDSVEGFSLKLITEYRRQRPADLMSVNVV